MRGFFVCFAAEKYLISYSFFNKSYIMEQQQPTYGNGKICYLEIPADNITTASSFYQAVFGWTIRTRNDGSLAFNDTVNEVSGTWVLNRQPHTTSGLLVYIMVSNVAVTQELIVAQGGQIIPTEGYGKEIIARFSDPCGNIFGIFQQ